MPIGYFIAYGQLARTTDSPSGAQLAEVLPLLREGAPRHALELWSIELRPKKRQ